MHPYFRIRLDECPPSVVVCRVAYAHIVRIYRLNPLQFQDWQGGLEAEAVRLVQLHLVALGRQLLALRDYKLVTGRSSALWRFDVCRRIGKAEQRAQDATRRAPRPVYPRITNRGVDCLPPRLEALPPGLPDVRTEQGRTRQ